jgi:ATP synthase protein I
MAADRPPENRGARDADDDALQARLRQLGQQLDAIAPKPKQSGDAKSEQPPGPSNLARALRLSSEFVAGILLGGFIGWLVDQFTGWSPWGLIVFLLLGFAAGTLNAMRSAGLVARPGQD